MSLAEILFRNHNTQSDICDIDRQGSEAGCKVLITLASKFVEILTDE